jgi:hypothetical protein
MARQYTRKLILQKLLGVHQKELVETITPVLLYQDLCCDLIN